MSERGHPPDRQAGTAGTGRVEVVVSVEEGAWQATMALLAGAGMEVHEVLEELGTVTGAIEPARLDELRSVPGVLDVEPSRDVGVPPPDADVQ